MTEDVTSSSIVKTSFLRKWLRRGAIGSAFGVLFVGSAVLYASRNVSIIDPPKGSALQTAFAKPTFIDRYEYRVPNERLADHFTKEDAMVRVSRNFFTVMPKWVASLMTLRDRAVSLVGLRSADRDVVFSKGVPRVLPSHVEWQSAVSHLGMNVGDGVGQFVVLHRDHEQILLGSNDKHLDFRIMMSVKEVEAEQDRDHPLVKPVPKWQFVQGTSVKVNNWLGYVYLIPVMPVHMILSRLMLQRAVDAFTAPYTA